MSWADDWDDSVHWDVDRHYDDWDDFYTPAPVTCNRCGCTNLRWFIKPSGKWWLADGDGKEHVCQTNPRDEFEVIDEDPEVCKAVYKKIVTDKKG